MPGVRPEYARSTPGVCLRVQLLRLVDRLHRRLHGDVQAQNLGPPEADPLYACVNKYMYVCMYIYIYI